MFKPYRAIGRSIWLKLVTPVLAAHLVVSGLACAENDASPYQSQRKAGIAHAEKVILEHLVQNPQSVQFRKVRYFEHNAQIEGRRVLTAIVVCGQVKTAAEKHAPYRRFLSWVFIDLETGRYNEDKYVVAIHQPGQAVDLYAQYHVDLCRNSEDGLSLKSRIQISKYQ